jgi:hypothetical protein
MMGAMTDRLEGHCPMGCGPTLVVAHGEREARCASAACPRPRAAAEILEDQEAEHIITIDRSGFTLRHPLRERLDDALLECSLHALLASAYPADVAPGRYRITARGDARVWERVG